ncbi:MAG TPA: flavodoxin family protein [Polyangiaceae bacterium]|nr:flavodoxin family protein [Polyangiaceae bacterium]
MTVVSVVYHSSYGHTRALAEHVAAGARRVEGVEVRLLEIAPRQIADGAWKDDAIVAALDASDAIVFGCPTYMGSVSWPFKAFLEGAYYAGAWTNQRWKDKIAGAFTNSASQSGDKLSTLFQLVVFASQMSMLFVGLGDPPGNNWSGGSPDDVNRLGSWLGLSAQSNGDQGPELAPSQGDRRTAERYGQRIASVARHWKRQGDHLTERLSEPLAAAASAG